MADQKLTALDAATTLGDADLVYVVDDVAGTPTSKKLTGANLKAAAGGVTATNRFLVTCVEQETAKSAEGTHETPVRNSTRWFDMERVMRNVGTWIEYEVPLSAGTWDLAFGHVVNNDQGIVDFLVEGISVGTIDTYASSGAGAVRSLLTGFSVPSSGVQTIRLSITDSNPSSSASWVRWSFFSAVRTGA